MIAPNDREGEQSDKLSIGSDEFHGQFMTNLTSPIIKK